MVDKRVIASFYPSVVNGFYIIGDRIEGRSDLIIIYRLLLLVKEEKCYHHEECL